MDWNLITETSNPASAELDTLSPLEIVRLMNQEDMRVAQAVEEVLPAVARAVEVIVERLSSTGRLLYFGAGTSGRLGVLDASECPPTFNTPPGQVQGVIAGGTPALYSSSEGTEDDEAQGAGAVASAAVTQADVVVGIAASGRTPYVNGALREARRRGAATVALVCNRPTEMHELADIVIDPLPGPEVISGSTRLKAGTAQKLVLNMLTTASMVRLGKVYGNLMVDLSPTNTKLRVRAIGIIARITGLDEAEAAEVLRSAGNHVPTAIVMGARGVDAAAARLLLKQAGGIVRKALQE